MTLFETMGVYTRVLREEAHGSGHGKIIRGRWLDINKGDSERPDYRFWFVGKEYNTEATRRCTLQRLLWMR